MMKPNISPMLRGSKLVPSTSPSPAMATHASGTNVTMIHQCNVRCACTPGAWTTEAIGSTRIADSTPWAAPDSTLAIATSQIGHGAWTRSSISRVKPNSWAMARAIDWTPWNITEIPTTPGTRIVANADCCTGPRPPMLWPIFGNTYRKTKHSKNGWMIVRSTNSQMCFLSTTRSRSISAPSAVQLAAATDRVGPPPIRRDGACVASETAISPAAPRLASARATPAPASVGLASAQASVPQLLAGQVDEHRLQTRFGDGQVHQVEPTVLGRRGDPGDQPVGALDVQLDPALHAPSPGDPGHLPGKQLTQPVHVANSLHRDDRVGADTLLQRSGSVQREDHAVVHDGHPLAQPVRFLHVVRGQQDRLAVTVQLTQ